MLRYCVGQPENTQLFLSIPRSKRLNIQSVVYILTPNFDTLNCLLNLYKTIHSFLHIHIHMYRYGEEIMMHIVQLRMVLVFTSFCHDQHQLSKNYFYYR